MKNLSKIFVAVVAGMFAFSCVTDATEDLGVKLGGQTEITLSLEESRTQLGEKAGDLYPLYWSEGDKISVNGIESAEAAISSNQAVATFTIDGTVAAPYCIAYPAAPAGQVIFAENQTHAGDTSFGNGVATMYAYSEGAGTQLNHLTGVLKIGVTGNATLSMAQISTADRAPIAGAFELDFATGELTATASSKSVINYNFPITADSGEFVLSNTPQYIHVAVPAGVYDELYVTLYDTEGGVMYATVKADEQKPLAVGKVREFKNSILYAANASVFVVKDKASLLDFAAQAATLEKDVLFVADVDMTGEAWTPIEGYTGKIIGNGYAINGLTAPLFGTTSASIKGLHLTNVVLNSNNNAHYGAFACELVSASETEISTIEHCSVSGTFTIENTEYTGLAHSLTNQKYSNNDAKASEMAYGGIVGLSRGININDCVNNMAITIEQIANMSNDVDVVPTIGGITGNAFYVKVNNVELNTHLTGCVNNADILYKDKSCNTETWRVLPAVGGISGGTYHHTGLVKGEKEEFATFHNCNNYGDITFQAVGGGQGQDTQGHPQTHVAGIVARAGYMGAYNCSNHGAITLDGHFKQTFSGGVCGASYYCNFDNCHNFGAITMTEESTFWGLMIAGISGNNYNAGDFVHLTNNCSNNAPITLLGSTAANAAKGMYHYRVGGCEGFGRGLASNLTNNKEGVITCKGTVKMMNTNFKGCEIGGVTAYRTTHSWSASKNYADINVDLNYSMLDGVEDTNTVVDDRALYIGAIIGYTSQRTIDSENKGNVTVKGTYNCESLFVSGAVGYGNVGANTVNHGKVTLDDNISVHGGRTYVGGVCGANDYGAKDITGVENHGDVYVGGAHDAIWLGGVFGHNRAAFTGAKNHGEVKLAITESTGVLMGGLGANFTRYWYDTSTKAITTGAAAYGYLTDCENHGEVIVALKAQITGAVSVGGLVKQGQQDLIGCVNYGNITLNGGGTVKSTYLAGLVVSNSAEPRKDCYNKGKITMDNYTIGGTSSTGSDLFIGGICYSGGSNTPYTNCHNEGDIEIGENVKVANCVRVAGFIPNVETASKTNTLENCSNSGNIIVKSTQSLYSAGVCRIGGIFAQWQNGIVKFIGTVKNSGNITFAGNQTQNIGTSLGGIIGGSDDKVGTVHADSNCVISNEGTISYTGTTAGKVFVGGIAAFVNKTTLPNTLKFINTGDINVTGTCGKGLEKDCDISGIIGNLVAPIDGAQCFCNIYAPKYNETRVGMITSKARSTTVLYTNAKVGGTICKSESETETMDGPIIYTPVITTVTGENFMDYIYGVATTWAEGSTYDGCTYISSKDEIDYSPVVVTPAE